MCQFDEVLSSYEPKCTTCWPIKYEILQISYGVIQNESFHPITLVWMGMENICPYGEFLHLGIPVGAGWEWEMKFYTYGNLGLIAPTYYNVL